MRADCDGWLCTHVCEGTDAGGIDALNKKRKTACATRRSMALAAPVIFQCGECHRVLTDSNQLLSAVAELGVLVVDAVVGVDAVEASPDDSSSNQQLDSNSPSGIGFQTLRCAACQNIVGRLYQRAPLPSLEHLVHQQHAPRFSLTQDALASYVLGSAGLAAGQDGGADANPEAEATSGADNGPASSNGGGGGTGAEQSQSNASATSAELDAMREQMAQLMRVVLALDQRLQSVEAERATAAISESEERRKRLR